MNFSLKRIFLGWGKRFAYKISGCTYCPLREYCEINQKRNVNVNYNKLGKEDERNGTGWNDA